MSYGYDPGGRLTEMVDSSGTTAYSYDSADRITQVATAAATVAYGYDNTGRRTSMTAPASTTTYDYDTAGRLEALDDTLAGAFEFTSTYGGVATLRRPNGVTTTNSYDLAGRLDRVDHTGPTGSLGFFDYGLDPNGNPTAVTSAEGTETYTLDDLDRLTAVAYPDGQTEAFTYNSAGDRLTATRNGVTTSYAYDAAGRLESRTGPDGTVTYSWDTNGNLSATSIGDTYRWTSRNMLASATVGGVTESYTYDASDTRVAVDGDDWLWDRLGGLPQLLDDGTASFLPTLATKGGGDATTYQLADRLGSVRGVTDDTGASVGAANFYAYGETRSTSGGGGSLGFTGQYLDPTGLVHLRARQYDPALGQFLSADTVQPNGRGTQGFGQHLYATGSPAMAADPSGHSVLGEYGGSLNRSVNFAASLAQASTPDRLAGACRVTGVAGGAAGLASLMANTPGVAQSYGALSLIFAVASLGITALSSDQGDVWNDPNFRLGLVAAGVAALSIATIPRAAGVVGLGLSIYGTATC